MGRIICLLLLVLMFGHSSKAAECDCKIGDPLIDKYHEYITISQFDSTLYYLEEIGKIKTPGCQATYFNYAGFLAFRQSDFEKAIALVQMSIRVLEKSDCDKRAFQGPYNTLGMIYSDADMLDSSAYYIMKSNEIAEELDDKNTLRRNYMTLAGVFGKMNQIDDAIQYIRKSIVLNAELKEYLDLGMSYNLLATAFSVRASELDQLHYTDSVDKALDQAYHYIVLSGNLGIVPNIYYNKGENFRIKQEYELAQTYLDSALLFSTSEIYRKNKPYWFIKKALISLETKQFNEGLRFCDSAMSYAAPIASIYAMKDIYSVRYQLYKEKGDFDKALKAHESMVFLDDSLNLSENTAVINELEKKYNQVKNEKTIQELNQQQEIISQQNEIQQLRITELIFGIALLVVVLIFSGFLFWQSNKRKEQKILEIEQRLNRARMNPHFIFNVLAAVQTLALDEVRSNEVSVYIARFSRIMRQSLESTFNELTPLEQELEFLTSYLELQKLLTNQKFDYEIEVDAALDVFDLTLPGMLIQPFVENSIEHGFRGMNSGGFLKLEVLRKKDNLVILISDNGKGVSMEKTHKNYPSRATQIISDRLYLLKVKTKRKAHFEIRSSEEGGIKVEIFLPLLYTE